VERREYLSFLTSWGLGLWRLFFDNRLIAR
jgi:hypothetical protein